MRSCSETLRAPAEFRYPKDSPLPKSEIVQTSWIGWRIFAKSRGELRRPMNSGNSLKIVLRRRRLG